MTRETPDLAAIVERDARWPEDGWPAMLADEDGLMFAVNDRRALLGLFRETLATIRDLSDGDVKYPLLQPYRIEILQIARSRLAALGDSQPTNGADR